MKDIKRKECDACSFNNRYYSDGFILKDWSGKYKGDTSILPKVPDQSKFWTYQTCSKSTSKVIHLNLDGQCKLHKESKQ